MARAKRTPGLVDEGICEVKFGVNFHALSIVLFFWSQILVLKLYSMAFLCTQAVLVTETHVVVRFG